MTELEFLEEIASITGAMGEGGKVHYAWIVRLHRVIERRIERIRDAERPIDGAPESWDTFLGFLDEHPELTAVPEPSPEAMHPESFTATQIPACGFVEVAGRVEPEALASEIANKAHTRVAELVILSVRWLEQAGIELNEKQEVMLAANALELMDGFEADVLGSIVSAIAGVRMTRGGAEASHG